MSNQRSEPKLVACPACGSQVSNQAVACPRCGQPIAARHIHPQPYQSDMQPPPTHRVKELPLTEWEKIFRMLGRMTSWFQSLTQPQQIALVLAAIIVPTIFISALIQGLPNNGDRASIGNSSNSSTSAENRTNTSQPAPSVRESSRMIQQ